MSYSQKLLATIVTILSDFKKKSGIFLIYILMGFCFDTSISEAKTIAQPQNEETVLVIHSYHPELSWTKQTKEEIDKSFQEIGRDVNVYHEYLDSDYYPELEYEEEFLDYLATKYSNSDIDLIMVSDDPGLELLIQQREGYFPDLPVVFLGVERLSPKLLEIPWLTGVFENRALKDTAIEATRQTWANTLVIVNDSSLAGKANQEKIRQIEQLPQAPKKIEIVNDLLPEDISDRLGKFPPYVPILLSGRLRKNRQSNSLIDYEKDVQLLQSRLPNPIYTENSLRLGTGVVGGKIFDAKYHIRQAVDLARQILDGTAPDQVGPLLEAKNRWVFDYRELNRFDIKVSLLPENSELLYKEPSFYQKYKELVWIVSLSFLFTLLIIALLIETIRRRTIQAKILRENEQRYKDLAEAGANVFWELDSSLRLCYISGNTKDMCGFESHDLIGKSFSDLYQQDPKFDFDWHRLQKIIYQQKPLINFTYRLKENESSVRIFKLNGNPIFDSRHRFIGYRGIKQEITAEHNLSKKITYQATYDSLTGLLNRNQFDSKLQELVKQTQESGKESVLCYLDLDRFKIVNDTAGHLAGDRLLAELAGIFKSMVSQPDVWGRLGGDEFGLLLENCLILQAREICEQLVTAIKNYRFKWQTLEFDVGVSIGLVPILPTASNATELLSRADLACYQAKNLGRGRVYVAESHDRELNLQQTQMSHIANVSQAITENRFYLAKQLIKPIVHDDREYMHYEILLRLHDRQGKIVPPGRFIPVAERYGVITIVDRWVLETTLNSYQQYFAQQQAIVSINLSGMSINDERFTDLAIDLIKNSPVQGDRLCFEITETAAISNIDRAQRFIKTMKELGVRFALDDFGSGVSSFAYLKSLPVDYLKIDGSLVRNVSQEECDRAIVSSINQVAHLMGMKTIAEFVEDRVILQHLDRIGVDYVQGYRIGKPVPVISSSPVKLVNNPN